MHAMTRAPMLFVRRATPNICLPRVFASAMLLPPSPPLLRHAFRCPPPGAYERRDAAMVTLRLLLPCYVYSLRFADRCRRVTR